MCPFRLALSGLYSYCLWHKPLACVMSFCTFLDCTAQTCLHYHRADYQLSSSWLSSFNLNFLQFLISNNIVLLFCYLLCLCSSCTQNDWYCLEFVNAFLLSLPMQNHANNIQHANTQVTGGGSMVIALLGMKACAEWAQQYNVLSQLLRANLLWLRCFVKQTKKPKNGQKENTNQNSHKAKCTIFNCN